MEMEKKKKEESLDIDEEKWVYDSSVDYKGRVPRRASTGTWKASIFIICKEFHKLEYLVVSSLLWIEF